MESKSIIATKSIKSCPDYRKSKFILKEIEFISKIIKRDQTSQNILTFLIKFNLLDLLIDFFDLLIDFFDLLIDFFDLLFKNWSNSMDINVKKIKIRSKS